MTSQGPPNRHDDLIRFYPFLGIVKGRTEIALIIKHRRTTHQFNANDLPILPQDLARAPGGHQSDALFEAFVFNVQALVLGDGGGKFLSNAVSRAIGE